RVENAVGLDQPLGVEVLRRVRGGVEHHVVARRRERAVGAIREPRASIRGARAEPEVAGFEDRCGIRHAPAAYCTGADCRGERYGWPPWRISRWGCGTLRCGAAGCGAIWRGIVCCGRGWRGTICCGIVREVCVCKGADCGAAGSDCRGIVRSGTTAGGFTGTCWRGIWRVSGTGRVSGMG